MTIPRFDRHVHRSGLCLSFMLVVGAVTAVLVGSFGSWDYAPTFGWAAAALTFLVRVWSVIGRLAPGGTAGHAPR